MKFALATVLLFAGSIAVGCGGSEYGDTNTDERILVVQTDQPRGEGNGSVSAMLYDYDHEYPQTLDGCSDLNSLETYPRGTECLCSNGNTVGCSSATCRGSSMQGACN